MWPIVVQTCSLNPNMESDFIPRKVRVRPVYLNTFGYEHIPEVFKMSKNTFIAILKL